MKTLKSCLVASAVALSVTILLGGCCNILNHTDSHNSHSAGCFSGTIDCADTLAVPFREAQGADDSILQSLVIIMYPLLIVDLPLEVAADTITLPYDATKAFLE